MQHRAILNVIFCKKKIFFYTAHKPHVVVCEETNNGGTEIESTALFFQLQIFCAEFIGFRLKSYFAMLEIEQFRIVFNIFLQDTAGWIQKKHSSAKFFDEN
jgi:hypothetical protein